MRFPSTVAAGTGYARFRVDDREVYGIVQGQRLREIGGGLFGEHRPTHADAAYNRAVGLYMITRWCYAEWVGRLE
jgi:hypothetical protein